jgi:uncharacterized membrane protein
VFDPTDEDVPADAVPPAAMAQSPRSKGEFQKTLDALIFQPLPFWLAVGLALGFGTLFGRLGVRHYEAFGSWAFDMGIYDNAMWKASRFGKTFMTVRGLEMWGHHFNPVMYMHAPAYWLGAGPRFLYVSQAVIIGLGAIAVYLIARDRLKSPWLGLMFAVAYVMYAPIGFISWANWHPEALVITPLLFAWWAARQHRWKMFSVFACLALTTREDAALVMTMMGGLLLWRAWQDIRAGEDSGQFKWSNRNVRAPIFTVLGSVFLYFFATKGVIYHYNGDKDPFYISYFYGEFGSNMFEVLGTMLRHPDRVVNLAMKPDRTLFYRQLLLPLAAAPLAGFPYLLMAGPQMLSSITSSTPYARSIDYQYPSMMIAPILIAAIEGVAKRVKEQGSRFVALAVILVFSYVSNVAWSNSPIGAKKNYWSSPDAQTKTLNEAVKLIPKDAGVVSTYDIGPHVGHRNDTYDWPNPWIPTYWGDELPDGSTDPAPHNPNRVTWVIFNRAYLDLSNPNNARHATLALRLIGPGGEFKTVLDKDNIVVAKRIRPDGPAPAAPDLGLSGTPANTIPTDLLPREVTVPDANPVG